MVSDIVTWPARRWLVAAMGAVVTGALIALPTALLPSGMFARMTPVTWWSWPVWVATALLAGLVAATDVHTGDVSARGAGAGTGGSLLGMLAVGCPACNKVVVAVIGATGAMQWWAPLQPLLGVASVALMAGALRTRLRGERMCRIPARTADAWTARDSR